ncbi:hepatocyte growth factor-like protein isoform X1 [Erpetoichthys calabaricus]|uniref:Macrophage stimulating 1 n=1 Tax=Erpetoichthys calabaricus TaxID=27687 RepID=A0A8C4TAI2_ERPCA|nr:hepatocyte growth factor-like protein isoform X1 [Erpetoichthys calabaricus]
MELPILICALSLCVGSALGQRSPLNDYQRFIGRELVHHGNLGTTIQEINKLSLEECAKHCSESLDCRSFNYQSHEFENCLLLPWTSHTAHTEVKLNVKYDFYEKKDYVRKCIVGNGMNYRGTVSVTHNGRHCQKWRSKYPHEHKYTPNSKNGLEENYCRNPDGDMNGPWCYTTDPTVRYESCKITSCEEEVCMTCNGEDYRGHVDHTATGLECQRWDLQHPHKHPYHPEKYPEKNLQDNYCRNPDASPSPWCYTTDPKVVRKDCKIPKCERNREDPVAKPTGRRDRPQASNKGKIVKKVVAAKQVHQPQAVKECFTGRGEDYRGKVNETTSGIPCQRWDSQFPHSHPFVPSVYECKGLEENYCRNPDGSEAPWCFTSSKMMRTAFCLQIKRCSDEVESQECYQGNGDQYRGTVSKTRKGITCQKWSADTPHQPKMNATTHPHADLIENYCRNPDADHHGPWCYTKDPKTEFDYCAIKQCPGEKVSISGTSDDVKFDSCGKREERRKLLARIVGGTPGNSPWTVSLRNRKGHHFCGGSLVSLQWVISTRQCFASCDSDLTGYTAMMGTLYKDPKDHEPAMQSIPIKKAICGPSDSYLVMLRLEKPAVLNERVAQICLPPERYIVPEGTNCEIAGWGETQGTGDNTILQIAQMPVLSNKECNKHYRGKIKENEICTNAFNGGIGACEQDYGGPLACFTHDCWVLEGVMIPMRRCGYPGQPNIFIRVSVYVDWIKKVMEMT